MSRVFEKQVFEKIEDLRCPLHPNSKFLKSTYCNILDNRPKEYHCEECLNDVDRRIITLLEVTTAYECPNCGFVIHSDGLYEYRCGGDDEDKDEIYYICRVCGQKIGSACFEI